MARLEEFAVDEGFFTTADGADSLLGRMALEVTTPAPAPRKKVQAKRSAAPSAPAPPPPAPPAAPPPCPKGNKRQREGDGAASHAAVGAGAPAPHLAAAGQSNGSHAKRQRTDGDAATQTPGVGGSVPSALLSTLQPPTRTLPPRLSSLPVLGSAPSAAQPPPLPPNERPSAIPPPPPAAHGHVSSAVAAAGVDGGASRIPRPGAHAPDAALCTFAPPAPLAPPAHLHQVWGYGAAACAASALQSRAFTLPTSNAVAGTICIRVLPEQPAAHVLQLQPLQPASSNAGVTATAQPAMGPQLIVVIPPTATPPPPAKAEAAAGAKPCAPQHPASGSVVCIDTAEVEVEEAPVAMDVDDEEDWAGDWAAAPSPSQLRLLSPLAQPAAWSLPRDREVADLIRAAAWQEESFGAGGVEEGELSLLIQLLG